MARRALQRLLLLLSIGFLGFLGSLGAEENKKPPADDPASLREEIEELKKRIEEQEKRLDRLEDRSKLRISGFFDVNVSNYENKPNVFEVGNFELDLEHTFQDRFQVAAALSFHEGAELSVGFIDYHIFGGTIAPRGRLFNQYGIHLQVGKFDVPFGNDWQYFSEMNRVEINPPLTTFKLMEGGYNDVGIRFLSNLPSFNLSLYVLRGIEEGYSYGGNSIGGRIGFTPFNDPYSLRLQEASLFELGYSYILDFNAAGNPSEKLWCVDIEGRFSLLGLRAEYYSRDKLVGILLTGYQMIGYLDFEKTNSRIPLVFYARYDDYTSERYETLNEKNRVCRVGTGFRLNISGITYLKAEYLHYLTTYDEFVEEAYFNKNQVFSPVFDPLLGGRDS